VFTSSAARTPTATNASNAANQGTKAHTLTASGLHLQTPRVLQRP